MANKMPKFDDRVIREQSKKISAISSSVRKLQKGELRRVSANRDINRLVSTTAKVVQKLGGAAEAMVSGIKDTTVGAAKYSKEAIKQYGQALQEDVQLDVGKLRTMTMAGGPVIGYFINKLIETPAFKDAIGSIKNKISETMSSAGSKFKDLVSSGAKSVRDSIGSIFGKISNVFGKLFGKRKPKELTRRLVKPSETKKHGVFVEKDGKILYYQTKGKKKIKTEIPQLQRGGVIGEGGLARLHPAEVVMPVEKLMAYQEKSRKLTEKSFTVSFKKIRDESYKSYEEPFHRKFIDGLFELKSAIVKDPMNLTYRLRSMWLGFLEKHPVFRNITRMGSVLFKTLTLPFKILFTKFGGKYRRLVSKNLNPLVSTAQTIGAFYPLMAWKQDQMIQLLTYNLEANRDTASALTGKKYGKISLVKFGRTSLAKILGGYMARALKSTSKFGWEMTKSLSRKIFKIEKKKIKREIIRTPMEILIDIQAKALFRLDIISRSLIPKDVYIKLMEKEYGQIRKMVNLTDAELGIEKKRLSTQEKIKKGIIVVGDKLEDSKAIFRKMKDIGTKTYNRTVRAILLERKQNETLDKVSKGIDKVRDQVKRSGRKQIEKLTEQIKHKKEHKKLSKRLSEKIDRIRIGTKNTLKSVFGKIWSVLMMGFGMIKGLFGKFLGAGGSLLTGLGNTILMGFGSIPILRKLSPILTKLGGIVTKMLPFAGKLATFGARYVAPLAAVIGTLYGAIKAQKKYGDPIGEKLSITERIGLGAAETLDVGTLGIFGIRKKLATDVEYAKRHREGIVKSEIILFKAYQNRLKRGDITQSAFDRITQGGTEGITERLIKLRKDKKIVKVGGVIMTPIEKFTVPGAKALFKKKITEPVVEKIGKVKDIAARKIKAVPEIAVRAAEKSKEVLGIAGERIGDFKKYAIEYISNIGVDATRKIKAIPEIAVRAAEKAKTGFVNKKTVGVEKIRESEFTKYLYEKTQSIKERATTPLISTSEIARIKAKERIGEIKSTLESDKRIQRSIDEMKNFQSVVVNNFNNASNAISNSVSNALSGKDESRIELGLDNNVLDIIRGDLD